MSDNKPAEVLEPGVVIKPNLTKEKAADLALKLYGVGATSIKEFNSYDDRNFFFKVDTSMPITNPYLKSTQDICPDGYVLKVTNTLDSKDPGFFEAQNGLILHLAQAGLAVPEPMQNVHGQLQSIQEFPADADKGDWAANNEVVDTNNKKQHIVRLLKFVPGKTLYEIDPWLPRHFYEAGQFVAKMDSALTSFHHEAYNSRNSIWFLSSIPQVVPFLDAVTDPNRRQMCSDILEAFNKEVIPLQSQLETGIIHGDFNEQNILVRRRQSMMTDEYEVFSVIDFGDSQKNPLIYELGITIMYMMTNCKQIDPNLAGGHVLAGYLKHRQLPEMEMDVLRMCVAARYAQSLVMGAYSYQQDPGNEYLLVTAATGWKNLTSFWNLPKQQLYKAWQDIVDSYNKE